MLEIFFQDCFFKTRFNPPSRVILSNTRGLRQGDLLSPYSFILYMEKLALLIQEKVEAGNWLPVKVSEDGPAISHLFFADNCLLFTKAKST